MLILSRLTARLAAASFAALLTAACNTDSKGPSALSGPALSASTQASAASGFAIIANQVATCTDATITGDVGTFQGPPTGSVTQTNCTIVGTVHVGDAAAIAAYNAFLNTYAGVATTPCDQVLTGTLAGVTLAPGVYCFDAAATLTGVLTLKGPANGVWLFKIGTSGTSALTGTNFSVVMEGGAEACNVTWWVAQAATLTDSHFIGTILAGAAITVTRGTFAGNAWSKADVTVTGAALVGCEGGSQSGSGKGKCNQGVGNGPEACDPGNSNNHNPTNDESGGTPGNPGRK